MGGVCGGGVGVTKSTAGKKRAARGRRRFAAMIIAYQPDVAKKRHRS